MTAIRNIFEYAKSAGQMVICTSRQTWREQDASPNEDLRLKFVDDRPNLPVVDDDHYVLGMHSQWDRFGGVCYPLVTDVVEKPLLATFKSAGLKDADAHHLMYAVHNSCDCFLTFDNDFIKRRAKLEALSRCIRILKPSELWAELATPSS